MTQVGAAVPARLVQAKVLSVLGTFAVFLGAAMSGFVIREPAPYDLYMVALIAVWVLFGLRFSGTVAILLTLWVAFNVGGALSLTQLTDTTDAPMYYAVSFFLALTAVFYAAIIEKEPRFFTVILNGWVLCATIVSLLGIAGYFGFMYETFTLYGRAKGTFQDPNVFGPYLVTPAVYLLYRIFTGRIATAVALTPVLLILVGGVFFSFSRGAWGVLLLACVAMTLMLLMLVKSGKTKLRIMVLSVLAVLGLVLALMIALQLPGVAEVFASRAQLEQSYDSAPMGRFGRHWIGYEMAMSKPFGIGAFTFGRTLGEDTHNIWLKCLMEYGWLGFASFVTIVVLTLGGGLKAMMKDRPWRPYLLCIYPVFVAHVALGNIIDIDHWRHFYMLTGMIWGAIALEVRIALKSRTAAPDSVAVPSYSRNFRSA